MDDVQVIIDAVERLKVTTVSDDRLRQLQPSLSYLTGYLHHISQSLPPLDDEELTWND